MIRSLTRTSAVELRLLLREPVIAVFTLALPLVLLFVLGDGFGFTPAGPVRVQGCRVVILGQDPRAAAPKLARHVQQRVDKTAADASTTKLVVHAQFIHEHLRPLSGCVTSTPEMKPTG